MRARTLELSELALGADDGVRSGVDNAEVSTPERRDDLRADLATVRGMQGHPRPPFDRVHVAGLAEPPAPGAHRQHGARGQKVRDSAQQLDRQLQQWRWASEPGLGDTAAAGRGRARPVVTGATPSMGAAGGRGGVLVPAQPLLVPTLPMPRQTAVAAGDRVRVAPRR